MKSPLLSDTDNLFPSFIGQLLMMEVVLAFLIFLGDGEPLYENQHVSQELGTATSGTS